MLPQKRNKPNKQKNKFNRPDPSDTKRYFLYVMKLLFDIPPEKIPQDVLENYLSLPEDKQHIGTMIDIADILNPNWDKDPRIEDPKEDKKEETMEYKVNELESEYFSLSHLLKIEPELPNFQSVIGKITYLEQKIKELEEINRDRQKID